MEFVPLLKTFAKERGWVKYQIDSYNNFIDFGIQKVMEEIGIIKLTSETGEIKLKFGKVEIGKPVVKEADGSLRVIAPNEARIRNLTYLAPVWVDVIQITDAGEERPEKVNIGEIPVMVHSKLCTTNGLAYNDLVKLNEDPYDTGGYFIVNGTERVLVLIEEISSNRPIIQKDGEDVKIRISSEKSGFKQRHVIERKPNGEITISFANIKKLSIVTLLRALGLETDKEICEQVSDETNVLNELYINLYGIEETTIDEAIDTIGKKIKVSEDYRKERVAQLLDRYLLPHLGQEFPNRLTKGKFLAKIVRKAIKTSLNQFPQDDIDHYSNKRLLMSGELLGQLFRSILLGRWGLIAKMTYNYQKLIKRGKSPNMQAIIEANAVTKQILSSLATGNWVGGRTGVSQRLDRSCYIKMVSHLRSVVSPLTSTQEHFAAREIHPTEFGRLCPAETPEGSSIGLRKHLALLSEITTGLEQKENEKILKAIRIGTVTNVE
ncbi:MAG: DNA-directed RNA polymerase subunit B'' [Candidatus Aenigmarchaeota archaeon]|nr:DNA-directed RNA polymerase subunit B'' [Candidatus Aenigmarchaeota archaeon]